MEELDKSEQDLNKKMFKDNEDIEFDKEDTKTFSQTFYNDYTISKQNTNKNYNISDNSSPNKKLVKNYDNNKRFNNYKSM